MPHSRVPDRIRAIQLPPFDPLNIRAAQLRADGHHVISLGQALPFFPPPRTALDGAREALAQADVHRYSTDPGLLSLRTTLAARLAADTGSTIDPEDLIITAGANHAFTLALTTLVDPGDEVIVPAPYFTNHQMAVCALGARAIEAPIADRTTFSLTWTDIEPHLTPRTRAVVLCTPSNPTGATIDRVTGARIVAECAARRLAVLSDETYAAFVFEGEPWSAASCDGWRDTVVVIGTFSKSFGMMGWRVGFLLADRRICEQATKVQDAMIGHRAPGTGNRGPAPAFAAARLRRGKPRRRGLRLAAHPRARRTPQQREVVCTPTVAPRAARYTSHGQQPDDDHGDAVGYRAHAVLDAPSLASRPSRTEVLTAPIPDPGGTAPSGRHRNSFIGQHASRLIGVTSVSPRNTSAPCPVV